MANKDEQAGKAPEVKVHIIKSRTDLALQGEGVLHSNALQAEDVFQGLFFDGNNDGKVIKPPYDPANLKRLVVENNTINQCIDAMVVNVDGTGFEIVPLDEEEPDTDDQKQIDVGMGFFAEPWPMQSFMTQRKQLRRDQEETGNAYLEVVRNAAGTVVFTRRLDAITVRMCRLSDAIEVSRKITREGKDLDVKVWDRERSFIQIVGTKKIYFREFSASRDIDKTNGVWAEKGSRLPADQRGTEIIHFTAQIDADTPYGVPRWITQSPSVVGSRKAEELNLEYFNSGGIPPVMILLQGGTMAAPAKEALENLLNGQAKSKLRAAITEIQATAGDVSSAAKVSVTVEKFGSEQQKDSLFEDYDKHSHERVRGAFRIPSLFLGNEESINFATAFASYLVAEAQVFAPERTEFDEIVTVTLLRDLGLDKVKFQSNTLSVTDASVQLIAIGMAEGVSVEERLKAINLVAGLDMKIDEDMAAKLDDQAKEPDPEPVVPGAGGEEVDDDDVFEEDDNGKITRLKPKKKPESKPKAKPKRAAKPGERTGTKMKDNVVKSLLSDPFSLLELARDYASMTVGNKRHDTEFRKATALMVKNLEEPDRTLFNRMLSNQTMTSTHFDEEGVAELARAAAELVVGDG